jgi:hypothetical protein
MLRPYGLKETLGPLHDFHVSHFVGQAGEDEVCLRRYGGWAFKRDATLTDKGFSISTSVTDNAKPGRKQVGCDRKAKLADSHHTDVYHRHFSPLLLLFFLRKA